MKVINQRNENLWGEVESSLEERTAAGSKMACIEAEKVFKSVLKSKNYPVNDIPRIFPLISWKLTDKEGLKKALTKTKEIRENFDYSLTSIEAEDTVSAFRQAINDFTGTKALSSRKKLTLFWQNYISLRSNFAKKALVSFFGFFLVVKLLSSTEIGRSISRFFISVADIIYSWMMFFAIITFIILIFIIIIFSALNKKKTRIKSVDQK